MKPTLKALLAGSALSALAFAGSAAAQAASAAQVEEIVVTANRRAENIQNVPVTVSAISGATAAARGIVDLQSLTSAVPALNMVRQANAVTPFLRGVGSQTGSLGNEPSVALYVDDVYIGTGLGSLFDFNNIDRVEVLRGPQGTLFGRNAVGGVVHVFTKDPEVKQSATMDVSYGNYDTFSANFYGTTGLTDNLAVNLALHANEQDKGWGRNLPTDDDAYTQTDRSIRAKALWTPRDNTRVLISGDWDRYSGDQGIGRQTLPGAFSAGGVPNAGFYNLNNFRPAGNTVKQWGASIKLDQGIGEFAELTSVTAYRNLTGDVRLDQDATPALISAVHIAAKYYSFSQELQLKSNSDGPVQWIVGGFYYFNPVGYQPLTVTAGNGAIVTTINSSGRTKSLAGFAQATVEVLPATRLTGGLRYTRDERTLGGQITRNGALIVPRRFSEESFKKPTWRLSLDHRFSDAVLAYASYNRGFKSGLLGSLDNFTAPPVNPEILDAYEAGLKTDLFDRRLRLNASVFWYDYSQLQVTQVLGGTSSTVNAGGARIKGVEFETTAVPIENLSLNAGLSILDGHYTSFNNGPHFYPAGAAATCGNVPFPANSPGGQVLFPGGCDLAGKDTIQTPKLTFNLSATKTIPMSAGDLTVNLSYAYNAGFYFEPDNSVKQPKTNLVNASVGWTSPSETWGVKVWGRNLLDEEYYSAANSSAGGRQYSAAPPLTFGVTLTAQLQ